ncbi:hypothetical protein [Paenibacillus sp. AR247]|uniref:hypothetical protein n=1 Tax=Paenibacillus sp. AR247 TaxID=1631599 RepID=UPI0021584C50|nr:hypothetical protein [Paenibacillus sp. AR247]
MIKIKNNNRAIPVHATAKMLFFQFMRIPLSHVVKVIQEPGPDALKLVKLHFNLTAVKGAAIRDDFHRLCYCILLKIIQFTFITIPILQPPEEGTYISVIHKQGDPLNPMRVQLMMLEVPCKKIIQKSPGKFIF